MKNELLSVYSIILCMFNGHLLWYRPGIVQRSWKIPESRPKATLGAFMKLTVVGRDRKCGLTITRK